MVCNGPKCHAEHSNGVCRSARDRYIGGRASAVVVADEKRVENLMRVEDEEEKEYLQ